MLFNWKSRRYPNTIILTKYFQKMTQLLALWRLFHLLKELGQNKSSSEGTEYSYELDNYCSGLVNNVERHRCWFQGGDVVLQKYFNVIQDEMLSKPKYHHFLYKITIKITVKKKKNKLMILSVTNWHKIITEIGWY